MAPFWTTWLCEAIAVAAVARTRGRFTAAWFIGGLALGPLALFFLLLLPVRPRTLEPPMGHRTTALQDWLIGLLLVGFGLLAIATILAWLSMVTPVGLFGF